MIKLSKILIIIKKVFSTKNPPIFDKPDNNKLKNRGYRFLKKFALFMLIAYWVWLLPNYWILGESIYDREKVWIFRYSYLIIALFALLNTKSLSMNEE